MPATFELSLPDSEPLGLIGPWEAASQKPVAFDAMSAVETSDVPVWRVNLPADETDAHRALNDAEAKVIAAESALQEVPARLESFANRQPKGETVSFDVASFGVGEDSPEASMLDVLNQARTIEQGQAVSYGIGEVANEAWEQAKVQLEAFLGQLQKEVLNFAWVETNLENQLLARTAVGWSGDSNTVWFDQASVEQLNVHRRALHVAVKSRALRMQMFTTVTGGAAKLSLLLTTPAGAVLALPAAWKYVNEILQQVKTYQTLTQGG